MDKRLDLSLGNLRKACATLEDPRKPGGNTKHLLFTILAITLMAVICKCKEWDEVEDYGKGKQAWLSTFLDMKHGAPSDDTYRRLFEALEPTKLEEVYRGWVQPYVATCLGKQVVIDGKSICGAGHWDEGHRLHLLSAWVREDGISVGQLATDEKSNEITAIPTLLETLEISGSTVTIDAMGCQTDIAQCIRDREADYVLAVKLNQPTLHEEIREYFEWAVTDSIETKSLDVNEEYENSHGRETLRRTTVTNDVCWFESKDKWGNLRSFIMSESFTIINDKISHETRFYISSLEADAKRHADLIRGHWSIENQLHWRLDVQFGEDACRIHKKNGATNLSLLRKIALAILKSDSSIKASIPRKQRLASFDNQYLTRLLRLGE